MDGNRAQKSYYMNYFKSILSIFSLVVILSSCKKDESINTTNGLQNTSTLSNTHFQVSLNLDGQHYYAEDGLNGYYNISFSLDHDTANFINWINFSMFGNGDTSSLVFDIIRNKLKPLATPMNVDDFRQLFHPGNHNYSTSPDSGMVIAFGPGTGINYMSNFNSDQAGSSFLITDTLTESDIMGPYFKFKAIFNCKVYDQSGNSKVISNGIVVCKFQPY